MISGTVPFEFGENSTVAFLVLVTDSSTPPETVAQEFQMIVILGASVPSEAAHREETCGNGIGVLPPYTNQAAAGTSNQSITFFGCIGHDSGDYGALSLNIPPGSGIYQVGTLTGSAEPPERGNCSMVQGAIRIDKTASPGPVQIGLKQVLDGCNENSNPETYYVTQFCPASLTLGQQMQQFPFVGSPLWNQGYRTGVGNYVPLQANPAGTSWDYAPMWENVNAVSNSCPASAQAANICFFNATQMGYVYDAIQLKFNNQQEGPTENILWDQHYFDFTQNVLASTLNGSCSATCRQWFYCGNTVENTFTVNFTLNEITPQPPNVPYTLVGATVH
jgi:hypothetical protein